MLKDTIPNDFIHLICIAAVRRFHNDVGGTPDNVFNAACFSNELYHAIGVSGTMDGNVVAAILCGRPDIVKLSGGAHYKLIE